MYKLVVVAGGLRGQEFILNDGENRIGNDPDMDVYLPVKGISKFHLTITVVEESLYLKDEGSANGTFVNGKLIKSITLAAADKVSLPGSIIQVVYVKENKIIVERRVLSSGDDIDETLSYERPAMPKSFAGKLIYFFKYRFMNFFYGMNEEYEWKVLFGIVLTLFIFITILLTIFPVMQDSKKILLWETAKRGSHYADEIVRMNSNALERGNLDGVDTSFLEYEEDVLSYELFDREGRIVRPVSKLNDYISDIFSIRVKDWALSDRKVDQSIKTFKFLLSDGQIGIGRRIKSYDNRQGAFKIVGIIAIIFAPRSLAVEASKNSRAYLEAVTTAALVAILFYGIIFYLTIRPIEELKYQLDEALRGKRKSVQSRYLFSDMKQLRGIINTLLQRVRELSKEESSDDMEEEDDGPYVTSLAEFLLGSGIPTLVLDSQKNIFKMNSLSEDLLGIRESSSQGENILDVTKEQGLAATILELCDMSANNQGTSQQGEYELTGYDYEIYITSLIGRDSFAKGYYITFIKDD